MTAPTLPRVATYRPVIRWGTGTGVDTAEFDDVSRWYLNQAGLVVDGIGRDQDRSYSPPKAPSFDLTLTNHDGRFSPGGPLALFLGRGPAVTLEADWGADVAGDSAEAAGDDPLVLGDGTTTRRLFTGTSVDMPQQISRDQRTVSVTAIGTLQSFVTTKPTTRLYRDIRTDEAVAVLLDAAGWPTDRRRIDSGDTRLLWWWLNGQTPALAALNAILAAEGPGACAFEDGTGTFHFQGRQFRDTNPRSQAVQWAFFDGPASASVPGDSAGIAGDAPDTLGDGSIANALLHVIPAEYASNPDEVVVSVAATIDTRSPGPLPQQVWEYGGPLVLGGAEVRDIQVAASDPFMDAIVPRLDTDFTIAGGGPLAAVSLLETSGQTVTLRLVAPPGGCTVIGVTSDGIRVRATSVPVVSSQTVTSTINTAQAAARQGAPNNPLVMDVWPELEPNQTLDLCNSMALRYQRERRQITFRFVNLDALHQYAAFDLRPSDRVQFHHTHANLSVDLFVETLHYAVAPGGGLLMVTVGGEQVFDLGGGAYDDAQFDLDVFGI